MIPHGVRACDADHSFKIGLILAASVVARDLNEREDDGGKICRWPDSSVVGAGPRSTGIAGVGQGRSVNSGDRRGNHNEYEHRRIEPQGAFHNDLPLQPGIRRVLQIHHCR